MKTYNKFVDYYDEIIRGNGYDLDSEVSFLSETISKFGKGKDILEFACGTGTIAKELIKQGYSVTGIDLSEQMIEKAKSPLLTSPQGRGITKIQQNKLSPLGGDAGKAEGAGGFSFQVGDMTSINLQKEFDIVLCNYNSVCHLKDWEAWQEFFKNAYRHIKKDGIFIFDILTLFEFENISRDFKGFFNVGDDTVCLEMFKEPTTLHFEERGDAGKAEGIYKWLIKMFVAQGDDKFELIEEEIREISFPTRKIKKELEGVGFNIEHLEDFHFGEVTSESERVYFVVKK